jgi:hypothetical protein
MTVDADLDGEREPGRQPDVDQAQFGIEEVEVQDALLSACFDQVGTTLAGGQPEAGAAFHAAEDTDQAFADRSFSEDGLDDRLLAMSPLKESIRGAGLLGQALGVIDQGLGLLLGKGHELTPSDFENVIDEPFEGRPIGDGQMTRETHAVETREHGDDQAGKLGNEARQRFHGVLLQGGESSNPILTGERRFCSSFLVAATPR